MEECLHDKKGARKIFDALDQDHDGTIEIEDFVDWLTWLHYQHNDERMYNKLMEFDKHNNGRMSMREVEAFLQKHPEIKIRDASMESVEKYYKENGEVTVLKLMQHL